MSDARALYQDLILDHGKHPRNAELPARCDHRAEGHNPLCGDQLTVGITLADGAIAAIGFHGEGCAISLASASLMTEALGGLSIDKALGLARAFRAMVKDGEPAIELADAGLEAAESTRAEPLSAFAAVARYPMRKRCATLCWETLGEALAGLPEG